MFNIGLSEILVVAFVSINVLDRNKVPVFIDLIRNTYKYLMIIKSKARRLLKDAGIEDLYNECNRDELRLRGETNAEIGGVAGNGIMDYSNQIFDANILVVDEDVFQAEQIYNVLKHRCRLIKILSDPVEALEVGIKNNYDLIISDMQFSKADGLRLCSKFRSNVETRYTPILILSEDYDKNNLVKALDVGVNDYLTVPLDEGELIARVNLQVKRKIYKDALRMNLFNNAEML